MYIVPIMPIYNIISPLWALYADYIHLVCPVEHSNIYFKLLYESYNDIQIQYI